MKTNHWQAKLPGDIFWTNVPVAMIENLRACGYQVRSPQVLEKVAA